MPLERDLVGAICALRRSERHAGRIKVEVVAVYICAPVSVGVLPIARIDATPGRLLSHSLFDQPPWSLKRSVADSKVVGSSPS